MIAAKGYAVYKAGTVFKPIKFNRREPGPKDVVIAIRYCGICHSDLHSVNGDWGTKPLPLVPGHEIAGVVEKVGKKVRKFREGDHAGVGCMVGSCGKCRSCKAGLQQYCDNEGRFATYGARLPDGSHTQGGYSDKIVVDEDFVLKIPKNIPLQEAAPLMCAGITTYSPLRHWKVGPKTRVGVIGLGGLGHMAVKLAASMKAKVTVISSSEAKKKDANAFGAANYANSKDEKAMRKLANSFDLVICTSPEAYDLNKLTQLLDLNGTLVIVGLPKHDLQLSPENLILRRRSIAGSLIGGIKQTQEMLDYCAKTGVRPKIQVMPISKVNEAYRALINNKARYRLVLKTA